MTAHYCFCQHSLFFVGFFPVSFDIGSVSNKFVSARIIYVIHLKISADKSLHVTDLNQAA